LQVQGSLRGIDHLHPELKSVHANADDAKRRILPMIVRRAGKMLPEASVLGMRECHRRGLGNIRTG
jgi:hypothetical protein